MKNIEIIANELVESIDIKKGSNANLYVKYLKDRGVKTNDNGSIIRKAVQIHLVKYGNAVLWSNIFKSYNLRTKEEVVNMYFEQLKEMLRNTYKITK